MAQKAKREHAAPKAGKKLTAVSALIKQLGRALLTLLGRLTKTLAKGEKYRGIVLGADGLPSHHLVLMPGKFTARTGHADALKWAESIGGDLPDRAEGSLLEAQNADGAIESGWHWLKPLRAGDPDCAWCQSIGSGGQYWSRRSFNCSAVAIRRIPIR